MEQTEGPWVLIQDGRKHGVPHIDYDYYLQDSNKVGGYIRLTINLDDEDEPRSANVYLVGNNEGGHEYFAHTANNKVPLSWALAVTGLPAPKPILIAVPGDTWRYLINTGILKASPWVKVENATHLCPGTIIHVSPYTDERLRVQLTQVSTYNDHVVNNEVEMILVGDLVTPDNPDEEK